MGSFFGDIFGVGHIAFVTSPTTISVQQFYSGLGQHISVSIPYSGLTWWDAKMVRTWAIASTRLRVPEGISGPYIYIYIYISGTGVISDHDRPDIQACWGDLSHANVLYYYE